MVGGDPAVVGRPGGDPKGPKGRLGLQQQQKFGTDLTRPVGDPAVVGRPRCGGETPLWWGDPARQSLLFRSHILVFRSQVFNFRCKILNF